MFVEDIKKYLQFHDGSSSSDFLVKQEDFFRVKVTNVSANANVSISFTSVPANKEDEIPEVVLPLSGGSYLPISVSETSVTSEIAQQVTAALHIPRRGAPFLPHENIHQHSSKRINLLQLSASNKSFESIGCKRWDVACPELHSCGGGRYTCAHIWGPKGNDSLVKDFPFRDYYPDAYADNQVFVLPSAVQSWNGNIVGVSQPGQFSTVLYIMGMCPWGNVDFARNDIQHISLHVPRAITLVHVYSVNFYHFIAETFPKYLQVISLLKMYPDAKILVSHKWNFLVDLFFPDDKLSSRSVELRFWGSGKMKVDWKNGGRKYKYVLVNQLFVSVSPNCGFPPLAAVNELRSKFLMEVLPKIAVDLIAEKLILVYCRNNFTHRRAILEHTSVLNELRKDAVGTSWIVRPWYGIWATSFRSDLLMLSQGRLLLGPHGAGLAAMIFLHQDSSVLEVRPSARPGVPARSCFEMMAWAAKIHFWLIWGRGGKETPMSVNVTEIVSVVRLIREGATTPLLTKNNNTTAIVR